MSQLVVHEGCFTRQNKDVINANFAAVDALVVGTQGKVFWVKPYSGSTTADGLTPATAFKTLTQALAACTTGQNDVVMLCAESNTAANTTDYQSSNLDWNKDMVHLIGVNAGGMMGQRSRVSQLATAATFADLFTVSANGCLISNVEFFQGAGLTDPSAASTCVKVTGMRNHFVNCQISGIGSTTLDDAGSNSLTVSGAENLFDDCYIGLDTVIRATSVTEVIITYTPTGSEKGAARNIFRRCHFETYTSGSTFKMISIATTVDRFVKFIDCDFHAVQGITSAVAPTGVIGITTMNGTVLVRNPYFYGFAQMVTADNAYVQMLGFNGLATGNLIGKAQGVDAA